MIKKPGFNRAQCPSDRLVSSTVTNKTMSTTVKPPLAARAVLTSFENVMNNLRNGTGTINRPTKRQASPEFRAPRPLPIVAKRLRRSRSVSDIDSIVNLHQSRKRAAKPFELPSFVAAKVAAMKVPFAPPEKRAKPTIATTSIAKSKAPSIAAHKKLVLNAAVTAKKTTDTKPKVAGNAKKIPAYDFKARFHDLKEKYDVLKEKHEHLKEQQGEFESMSENYDECRANLVQLETDYKTVQEELATLKHTTATDQLTINSLNDELNAKIEECRIVTEAKNRITKQYTEASTELVSVKANNTELQAQMNAFKETIERQATELQEAADQLYRANIERKDLHNTIMDLRGNIRVFCRIRPSLIGEENRTICSWQHNDETSLEIGEFQKKKKSRLRKKKHNTIEIYQ